MNERIDIAPILQGRINKTDLIGPEAHIFQVIYYENLGSGVMFSVSTHNYLLQLGMNDDSGISYRIALSEIANLRSFKARPAK